MQYRNLGKSGLKVSTIGLGTNQFGGRVSEDEVKNILDAALDTGINFIDTANLVYQEGRSEISIGKAMQGRRDQFVIATKVYMKAGEGPNDKGLSRRHIMDAVEGSLQRLQTEYIDVYQMHRWDVETPIEESLRAFDDLVTQGKIRYYGSSNFTGWQLAEAQWIAKTQGYAPLISEQPHFHMLQREVVKTILPAAKQYGLGILPYFPLAGGFLTGKYKRGANAPAGTRGETSGYVQKLMANEKNYDAVEQLEKWATEHEHSLGELAHAWLLAHPEVSSVISGATKTEHLIANAKGGDWNLSAAEFGEVNAILDGVFGE